jgi:hypothetical protein
MMTFDNNDPKPEVSHDADGNSQLDQEAIIEQIWKDLGDTASRSHIRSVVIEIAPRYTDARILTYVPIFLGKEVRRRLLGSV